jgi:hypothetical protein
LLVALMLCPALAGATTVIAPTFDELTLRAERVVIAEVVDVESRRMDTPYGATIVTDVTFKVERTLKGDPLARTMLQFLGGTVGDEVVEVKGMPRFRIGDRDVLFIRERGRPISALVALMYGRFRVTGTARAGDERVWQHDFAPLRSIDEIGRSRTPGASPFASMRLADFVSRVIDTVARQARAR